MILRPISYLINQRNSFKPFEKEIKLNADDTATPTYSSELFSITKADGSTQIGQQQGDIVIIPNSGLNNQDWIGTITKVNRTNPGFVDWVVLSTMIEHHF